VKQACVNDFENKFVNCDRWDKAHNKPKSGSVFADVLESALDALWEAEGDKTERPFDWTPKFWTAFTRFGIGQEDDKKQLRLLKRAPPKRAVS